MKLVINKNVFDVCNEMCESSPYFDYISSNEGCNHEHSKEIIIDNPTFEISRCDIQHALDLMKLNYVPDNFPINCAHKICFVLDYFLAHQTILMISDYINKKKYIDIDDYCLLIDYQNYIVGLKPIELLINIKSELYPVYPIFNTTRYMKPNLSYDEKHTDYVVTLIAESKYNDGDRVLVDHKKAIENLQRFTYGIFDNMNWTNVVMVGGSLSLILQNMNFDEHPESNINLYVWGDKNTRYRTLHRLINYFRKKLKCYIFSCHNVITIVVDEKHFKRNIQIYDTKRKSILDAVKHSDCTLCKVVYDGHTFSALPEYIHSLATQTALFKLDITFVYRMVKFYKRGFSILFDDSFGWVSVGTYDTDTDIITNDYLDLYNCHTSPLHDGIDIHKIKNMLNITDVIVSERKYFYPDGQSEYEILQEIKNRFGSKHKLILENPIIPKDFINKNYVEFRFTSWDRKKYIDRFFYGESKTWQKVKQKKVNLFDRRTNGKLKILIKDVGLSRASPVLWRSFVNNSSNNNALVELVHVIKQYMKNNFNRHKYKLMYGTYLSHLRKEKMRNNYNKLPNFSNDSLDYIDKKINCDIIAEPYVNIMTENMTYTLNLDIVDIVKY